MPPLKNTFSWSYSAASDFETCRRKRYWAKYRMWGGWGKNADSESRTAYRLCKMESRHTIKGVAVEDSIMWMLKQHQGGRSVTIEEAYEEIARPYLNRCWLESKKGNWREQPKQFVCLHEHYYPQFLHPDDADWPKAVAAEVKTCIENFHQQVLPRLRNVRPDQEVPVRTVSLGGDPESFEFEGIKVYAIPDYVHRDGETWHIHDWKSGRSTAGHSTQIAIYGLWAGVQHGVPPERIETHLEYLFPGQTASARLTQEDLDAVSQLIRDSVADMEDYLEEGDRKRNIPVGKDEWDMVAEASICRRCNFYELCRKELDELSVLNQ